jgi:hypothetical protein
MRSKAKGGLKVHDVDPDKPLGDKEYDSDEIRRDSRGLSRAILDAELPPDAYEEPTDNWIAEAVLQKT